MLVAVSGGPDSIALLDMLVRLSIGSGKLGRGFGADRESATAPSIRQPVQTPSSQPIFRVHVAHLNHMLRGNESAEDAEFVRRLAERLGLAITTRSVDVAGEAARSGLGIEEMAREIRYDFLVAAALETGCERIAVGHTMNDQAETFLMRLVRGAGQRGLAGMRPVTSAHDFSLSRCSYAPAPLSSTRPSLIRPLLCITREEVEAYCGDRGLEFRTDSTNLTLGCTRNRIRSDVLPVLKGINPRIVQSLSRATENIAGDEDVLDDLAQSLLGSARLFSKTSRNDEFAAIYSVSALLAQPIGMRRRMIVESLRLATPTREQEGATGEISSVHVNAIEKLLTPKASGKRLDLPLLEVWREFDTLVIKASGGKEAYQSMISRACPRVEAGGLEIELQRGLPAEMRAEIIEGALSEKRRNGADWMTVALDDQALPEELVLRPRRRGERAHVVGQRKTIKLKNLMIDHRIPSSRRATWPVVTTPDGKYVWSPGLPPSIEFTAHSKTLRLATMRAAAI